MTAHAVSYELAVTEAKRGNWETAERHAREAVALGGDRYAGCLGKILMQAQKYEEARTWLLRAVAVEPTDPDVLFFLGAMSGELGMRTEGLAYLDRALSVRPDFPEARWSRDRIHRDQLFFEAVRETLCKFERNQGRVASDAFELGDIEFPSTSLDTNGQPRFTMCLPAPLILTEVGAAILFYRELTGRGYEFDLRRFIDLHLSSDDVFVDVGAHWGVHSLTAATLRRREISVLAVEAHPENAARLATWVKRNQLEADIEIIPAAIGEGEGVGRLIVNASSMGHTMRKSRMDVSSNVIDVKLTTLDRVFNDRPHLRYRRSILKLDVEGCELEALTGARDLLSGGTVEAVIWENGSFEDPQLQALRNKAVLKLLGFHGYEHFYIEDENRGVLVPFEEKGAPCNVYSLARGFERRECYL